MVILNGENIMVKRLSIDRLIIMFYFKYERSFNMESLVSLFRQMFIAFGVWFFLYCLVFFIFGIFAGF